MGKITKSHSDEMGGWLEYKPDMRWTYLDRALDAQGAGAWESTLPRTDNKTRRTHEPVGILAIEVLPIGDGSPEPTP